MERSLSHLLPFFNPVFYSTIPPNPGNLTLMHTLITCHTIFIKSVYTLYISSQAVEFMTLDTASAPLNLPTTPTSSDLQIPLSRNRFAPLQLLDNSDGDNAGRDQVPQGNCHPLPSNPPTSQHPLQVVNPLSRPPQLQRSTTHSPMDHPVTQSTVGDLPAQSASQALSNKQANPPRDTGHNYTQDNCDNTQNCPPASSPVVVYLRNVPSRLSIQEVEDQLSKGGITLEGYSLTMPLSESSFSGSTKKFLKVTCANLDRCNLLDQGLKNSHHLPWFLSLLPPRKPSRKPSNTRPPVSQCPHDPAACQPFLSKRPLPLMSLKLPPLSNKHPPPQCPPNTAAFPPIRRYRIPALMSLQLPPLPAQTTCR